MSMQCVIYPEWLSSCSFFSKSAISTFFKFEPLHAEVGRFAVGEGLLGFQSSVPVSFTNSVSRICPWEIVDFEPEAPQTGWWVT